MANDKVAIWDGAPKLGRSPASGEILVGDGSGFDLVNAGISDVGGVLTFDGPVTVQGQITNTTGGYKFPDNTVQTTAATSYSPPSILPVSSGGTGANTLTSNNVILGNGTSAVQFVAPGASGNLLQSNGTTWASAPVSYGQTLLATLTTTSGANAGLTGISTTAYTGLNIVLIGLSHNGTGGASQNLQVQVTEDNGSNWIGTTALVNFPLATSIFSGVVQFFNIKTTVNKIGTFVTGGISPQLVNVSSTAAMNGVRFNFSLGASFDAGTILIYGVP